MATDSPVLTIHKIVIVASCVWRVTTSCLPRHDVLEVSEPVTRKENGSAYSTRSYTLDESRTIKNFAVKDEEWESLVMTGKCDWFCVMMEEVIRDRLQGRTCV